MKKIIIIITGILSIGIISAQSELDAVKYVQDDIQGTARYMGMAGAFGALGGDVSAIKDNPAGLGIFRSQELSFTINSQFQNSKSTWGNVTANDNMSRTKFNNFSYIVALPTWRQQTGQTKGLLGMNFGFTYNKLKSLDRSINIRGGEMQARLPYMMAELAAQTGITDENAMGDFENTSVGWLSVLGYNAYLINLHNVGWLTDFGYSTGSNVPQNVIPTYTLYERGYIDEYGFTWSGNFSNRFYMGIGVNIQSMTYDLDSKYSEQLADNSGNFTLRNIYSANGFGFNVSIGGLYKITKSLRASAAVHTNTVMLLNEQYYPDLDGITPDYAGKNSYAVNRPFSANLGLAYIFGKKGLLSAEYVFKNYKNTYYADNNFRKKDFEEENDGMKNMFLNGHTIKIGGEYRVTNNFSVRAGYALQTSMVDDKKADKLMWYNSLRTDAEYFVPKNTNYFSIGLGFQGNGWFFDLALMQRRAAETFMPFSPTYQVDYSEDVNDFVNIPMPKPADISIINNNIIATFGLRF
ncbi:MAG: hypothetical protein FWD66_10400 [Paludibacter sp.]|nr:hypothetical protein [Paludibacter sp.]